MSEGAVSNVSVSGATVLVIDGNDHMRALVRATLQALGVATIAEARDGNAALRRLAAVRPDLVICDAGTEGAGKVLEQAPGMPPVVLLTGPSGAPDLADRAAAVLEKPVSAKKLYAILAGILGDGTVSPD